MTDPRGYYQAQLEVTAAARVAAERRSALIGSTRLLVFVVGLVAAALAIAARGGAWGYGVLGAALLFAGLVAWHERVVRAVDRLARSEAYFRRGLARLDDQWTGSGDDGQRFADPSHLYTSDLEIFGAGSLFHLIAETRTETGAATLAAWLATPADPEVIRERQAALQELAPNRSFRHDLAVVAARSGNAVDSQVLRQYLAGPPVRFPFWAGPLAAGLAVVNVLATGAALAGQVDGLVVVPGYAFAALLALSLRARVSAILRDVDRPARELRNIAAVLERLGRERFRAPRLQTLAQATDPERGKPVALIARLGRLVDLIDARRNQLFLPLAGLLLLGTQLAMAIERWRIRVGQHAVGWLDHVGELEALCSLATQAHDHPADCYPDVGEPGEGVRAVGLAHPLLPVDRVVRNDLALGAPCRLLVISGSNMSGKSTLLKALGQNVVLAQAGAPVRAKQFRSEPLAVGASLVIRDSLLEGRSRFYAEILRLKAIVAATELPRPVLFLLDELLSGTNSHDRAIGARGVLVGLVERGALGLVTTHDLALTALADELGGRGANQHLDDQLLDGQLHFDYRLKPGVVERSNALALMRAVGLDVEKMG